MSIVYHLAAHHEWQEALRKDFYSPATLETDGYILCTTAEHYVALANRHFAGRSDLLLLFIEEQCLNSALLRTEVEGLSIYQLFAPLPLNAVFEVATPEVNAHGEFTPHHEMQALAVHGETSLSNIHARVARAMAAFNRPWWVAGGWAIDTFLGERSRPHADLEISILSADQPALRDHLRGWEMCVAGGGKLTPWNGQPLAPPFHQIWSRQGMQPALTPDEFSADPTMLDCLIESHSGDLWQFRRDARISCALPDFGGIHDNLIGGIPYVRPEIALLYKAKGMRFKDQRDFERTLPHLDGAAQQWLHRALQIVHPQHPWCALLNSW